MSDKHGLVRVQLDLDVEGIRVSTQNAVLDHMGAVAEGIRTHLQALFEPEALGFALRTKVEREFERQLAREVRDQVAASLEPLRKMVASAAISAAEREIHDFLRARASVRTERGE